jgi:hypothetical protein
MNFSFASAADPPSAFVPEAPLLTPPLISLFDALDALSLAAAEGRPRRSLGLDTEP